MRFNLSTLGNKTIIWKQCIVPREDTYYTNIFLILLIYFCQISGIKWLDVFFQTEHARKNVFSYPISMIVLSACRIDSSSGKWPANNLEKVGSSYKNIWLRCELVFI